MRDFYAVPIDLSGKVNYESMLVYSQDEPMVVILHFIEKDLYFLADTFWNYGKEEFLMVKINPKMIDKIKEEVKSIWINYNHLSEIDKYMDTLRKQPFCQSSAIYIARFIENGAYIDAHEISGFSIVKAALNFNAIGYFYDKKALTEIKCPKCGGTILFSKREESCPLSCRCDSHSICPVCYKELKKEFTPDVELMDFGLYGCECGWQHCGCCT